jgi:hypothetical protein
MPFFVRTIWFDNHDQLRVRLPMKLVCNLLKQRLSFFVILRNLIQGPHGRFRCRRRILFSAGTRAIIIRRKSQWVILLCSNRREAARAWGRHRLTTARWSFSPVFGENAFKTRATKQNARAAYREGDRGKAAASRAALRKNKAVRARRLRHGQARPPARVQGAGSAIGFQSCATCSTAQLTDLTRSSASALSL